jgi:putative Mg2+ transporter-C (MgtC) family protein
MDVDPKDLLGIALATALGGLIGIERELRDKAAGFRTIIFICVGACLFTILSRSLAGHYDPNRIAANIVVGVGFLGAGVILRQAGRITGLTTAALIWFTAAVGMGLGGRQYALMTVVSLLGLFILWTFPLLEKWIDGFRQDQDYVIVSRTGPSRLLQLEALFRESGLRLFEQHQAMRGEEMTLTWRAVGPRKAHERLRSRLSSEPDIREFRF